MFQKATRKQARLHLALIGPAGSGKTYTSLRVANELGGKVALIDTERSSACNYANLFGFDVCELDDYHPRNYIDAIKAAGEAGYNVLIIDSLSHAWSGKGGALEMVDKASKRSKSGNSFAAWREITPLHNELVETLLSYPGHVIVTMRAKMAYVQEKDNKGRVQIRKVGLQPLQRDGLEYEFDIVGDMDTDNNLVITKTRCPDLRGAVIHQPGGDFAAALLDWIELGHTSGDKSRRPATRGGHARREEPAEEPAPRQARARRAPPEEDFEPPAEEHDLDSQDAFEGAVIEAGFNLDDVKAFFVAKGRGDLGEWPDGRRTMALQWLTSDAGRQSFDGWLQERDAMPDFDEEARALAK
jgi:DNA polymerase III delta prime subunit